MLQTPMVSIIIPIYNAEKYMEECLSSVAHQTFQDFECIMIDDGSVDGSGKIAQSYAERDGRFQYVYQKNAGVSASRNLGMKMAKGKYVAFVDADDWIADAYLQTYVERAEATHAHIVWGGYVQEDVQSLNYTLIDTGVKGFLENLILQNGGVVWGKLFARGLLESIVFDDNVSMREDLLFQLQLVKHLSQDVEVAYLQYYGYYYRDTNIGLSKQSRTLDCSLDSNMTIIRLMIELNVSKDRLSAFIKDMLFWDCMDCIRRKESLQTVVNSPMLTTYGEYLQIQTFKDKILFGAIKKRKTRLASFVYRLYSVRFGKRL